MIHSRCWAAQHLTAWMQAAARSGAEALGSWKHGALQDPRKTDETTMDETGSVRHRGYCVQGVFGQIRYDEGAPEGAKTGAIDGVGG
jgi:hypothetical protein